MPDEIKTNGAFDIDGLTDLIVPFEFEFEGRTLKGRWYKYKTTTPEWEAARRRRYIERLERFAELNAQMKQTSDTALIVKISAEKNSLQDEATRAQYDWLADSLVEWNAVYKDQTPIPIESIKMAVFPIPFMVALGEHLEATRTGANPTSSDSPSGT